MKLLDIESLVTVMKVQGIVIIVKVDLEMN